ncbi:mechanosensitive ion channel family protein [Bacillus sp. JCM 19041]|uniref:mechanosensitive ion channel family protein n=1 Tax=Bacillus sp. JCM 19041 TaxID=1460637 RepID=UPI0006D179CD
MNFDFNEWLGHPIAQTVWQIILALIIFFIVRAAGRKIISKAFQKPRSSHTSQARMQTLEKLMLNVFSYVLFFIIAFNILESLGFHLGPLLAAAGVLGLAIGFGAQGLVSDVVTGFFLLLERQLEVGDYVTAGGVDGIVEELGFRTTLIRGFDGTLHYLPNRNILNVDNHSRGNMRALVDLSIPAGKKTEESIQLVQDTLKHFSHPAIVSGPEVVGVETDDMSATVIRIIAKTGNMQQWDVERAIRKTIRASYEEDLSTGKET